MSILHNFLLALAAGTTLLYVLASVSLYFGNRRIANLLDTPPLTGPDAPAVSVVFAARDEERGIERALQSMLQEDYPNYEVIAVNDRSTDGTGEVLERMARTHERLRVVTVRELPAGWLGKNHALHIGAEQASSEFLVFTDADIVMEPTALARAVHYALRHHLDHLAVSPRTEMRGFLLNALFGLFALSFNAFVQPWKTRDPKSRKHIGIGAFNLVRTSVYRALGGHEPIRMRPDDDMKLGKLIKNRGYRQDFAIGSTMLSVEWYPSLQAMMGGLMKNMFAGLDYRVSAAVVSAASLIVTYVWPFLALALTTGSVRTLNALLALTVLVVFATAAGYMNIPLTCAFAVPLSALLFAWIILRSMTVTLWNGGIEWRGTRYPLDELRANKL